MIEQILLANPDIGFIKLDGLDACVIGFDENSTRLIYSKTRIIEHLLKDMTLFEAMEFYDYNIYGLCVTTEMPILCDDYYLEV
jgi:hypothetical protein